MTLVSVRVEGFPSPDAKTIMEVMEDDESEKLVDVIWVLGGEQPVVNLSERLAELLRVQRKTTSQELVGDIQLADDGDDDEEEDPKKVLRVKSMPVNEESTPVERGSRMAIKVFGRQVREKHKCRKSEKAADYGCNTVVPAVCCMNGFLKDEIQQKEDDC